MRRGIAIALATIGLLLLAAWVIPPSLDASRFRATLEEVSSEALGAPVHIRGTLAFSLLPTPTLTATQVTLGSGGAALGTALGAALGAERLYLRVATLPLLAGRFDALELVLGGAELRMPWPRPPGPLSGAWNPAFTTRVERSRAMIGNLEVRDIAAEIAAAGQGGMRLQGSARALGQLWRITANLGAPSAGGEQEISLEADTTGASPAMIRLAGRAGPDGTIAAQVGLRIPDLAPFAAMPAVPVRADGSIIASSHGIIAEDWTLALPNATARAGGTLVLDPVPSLNLRLTATRMNLDPWAALLRSRFAIPVALNLAVEAATLGGDPVRQLRATIAWSEAGIQLKDGHAILPGDADLILDGTIPLAADTFTGKARLIAPDLRSSLHWLEKVLGRTLPLPPAGTLRSAELAATIDANARQIALTELRGRIDQTDASGSFALRQDQRPALQADLVLGRIVLDPWLAGMGLHLPGLAQQAAGRSADIRIQAREARLAGQSASPLTVDASITDGRIVVRKLSASLDGMRAEAAGSLAEDGRLQDGVLELTGPSALRLMALLPERWQATRALWDAPISMRLDAGGAPDALALRITGELGDLRQDAQLVLDAPGGRWSGRVTTRHPGAQRLLAALGLLDPAHPGSLRAWAPDWPGQGSFAATAQIGYQDGRLAVDQADVTAGGLRASGQGTLEWQDGMPAITARLQAEALPLPWPPPSDTTPIPVRLVRDIRLAVQFSADTLLADEVQLARRVACTLTIVASVARLAPCGGRIADGAATLDATLDTKPDVPRVALDMKLEGARLGAAEAETAAGPVAGYADATLKASGQGHSPATLLAATTGTLAVSARDATIAGFDLAGIGTALAEPEARPVADTASLLRKAVTGGRTVFAEFSMDGEIARGLLRLAHGQAAGPAGAASVSGSVALADGTADLQISLRPAGFAGPPAILRAGGTIRDPVLSPDLLLVLRWLADRPR